MVEGGDGAQRLHWGDVLRLRDELRGAHGEPGDLQMSLYAAVFRTSDVPYQEARYYGEITEPTYGLVGFMAQVANRLWGGREARALFHLDQGMGGGKSHALVGLYHMTAAPDAFFATELGQRVRAEAEARADAAIAPRDAHPVVLSGDHMTPGTASAEHGPATTLHERFLWSLFQGDRALYTRFRAEGANKSALRRALEVVNVPVLILLDELMDYALALSSDARRGGMADEQGFLNALMDVVDDLPQVVFVVVMMRSEFDEQGYTAAAEEFRGYITQRLERNGVTVTVTNAQDFSAIIRRRLFEDSQESLPIVALATAWREGASEAWTRHVFEQLPSERSLTRFAERVEETYPFHPDLMGLVREDWSRHAGFQRVRSTVRVFARTAYYWWSEHASGRWVPELIGVGDVPLPVVIEEILSSGLLHGNERAVQGFREVAAVDVVAKDGERGRAIELSRRQMERLPAGVAETRPVLRMATSLFLYSLVPRAQARRGATKAEMLSAAYLPDSALTFQDGDEIFTELVGEDEGLGALDVLTAARGSTTRYQLTIAKTLRMFFRQARQTIDRTERDRYLWERTEQLAAKGPFDRVIPIEAPVQDDASLADIFGDVDEGQSNRLVVLDPRRWRLMNGDDRRTGIEVEAFFGLGDQGLRMDWASSCVVACANTQRWENVRQRAMEALAYRGALRLIDAEDELYAQAQQEFREAERRTDDAIRGAFQHNAYLVRTMGAVGVEWKRFDQTGQSALSGRDVWHALVQAGRAAERGQLAGAYLRTLVNVSQREYGIREVFRKFWQDPALPLVPTEDDARSAIYDALQGDERWELVSADGEVMTYTAAEQVPVRSMDLVVRTASSRPTTLVDDRELQIEINEGSGSFSTEVTYRRYRLELPHRSMTDGEQRRRTWLLVSALADALDQASGIDLQMVQLSVALTAQAGSLEDMADKARAAAARWAEEEDEFGF